MESLKIDEADIVLSSSHCVAKGIRIPPGAVHISYIHTPMRYLYGFEEEYFSKFPAPLRWLIQKLLGSLRNWDLASNAHVNYFISNSENVRRRIQDYYQRDAEVICPPVDSEFFTPSAGSSSRSGSSITRGSPERSTSACP